MSKALNYSKFHKGDRVRLSPEGLAGHELIRLERRKGEVVGISHDESCVVIQRDHVKGRETWAQKFWELDA